MQWNGIERLTYYVLFPALIIDTLSRADLSRVPVVGVGGALFLAIVVMAALVLAMRPWLAARFAVDGPAFTSVLQGATRWNTFVALVLAASLFETLGVALASVAIVAMIPVLNVINVWALTRYASKHPRTGPAIAGALMANPLIWSCVVGLALNLLGLPLTGPLHAFADALGRASLACGLLSVGAGLQIAGLIRPSPPILIATALKLVLMPVLAISLGLLFGVTGAKSRGDRVLLVGAGAARLVRHGAAARRRRSVAGADPDAPDHAGDLHHAGRDCHRQPVLNAVLPPSAWSQAQSSTRRPGDDGAEWRRGNAKKNEGEK